MPHASKFESAISFGAELWATPYFRVEALFLGLSECLASLGPLESLESRGRRVNSGECDHRSNAFRIKK